MQSAPRLPAIVGAAQRTQRVDDPREALPPLGLMEQSLRAAAEDAGAPKLLEELDAILVPRGLWKYGDPGRLLAERVGAGAVTTALVFDPNIHLADDAALELDFPDVGIRSRPDKITHSAAAGAQGLDLVGIADGQSHRQAADRDLAEAVGLHQLLGHPGQIQVSRDRVQNDEGGVGQRHAPGLPATQKLYF